MILKKKNLIFLLLIAIILFSAVFILMSVFHNSGKKTVEESLFSVNVTEQIDDVCKDFNLEYAEFADEINVYDVNCFGEKAQFIYTTTQNQVQSIQSAIIMFGYKENNSDSLVEYTASELNRSMHNVLEKLCEMNGTALEDRFFIFEQDDVLDNGSNESYQKIINGTAHIEFSIKDANGYYWKINSEVMNDGAVFLMINKFYDTEAYSNEVPNIDLY